MASTLNASTTLGLISSADTSGVLQLQTASTTAVTINASQNVGIGTASPSYKLDVNGTISVPNLYDNSGSVRFKYSGANAASRDWRIVNDIANYGDFGIQQSTTQGGSTFDTKLMFSSTGNLGLGVTPSAWGSYIRALQVNNTGMSLFTYSAAGTVDQYAFLSNNSFQNSSYAETYVRTNPAAQYRQLNATHAWFNAPSGTAGNPITFTQAMTLDSGGNLGIGTTNPVTKLDVSGASGFVSVVRSSTNAAVGQRWIRNGTTVGEVGSADAIVVGGTASDFGITTPAGFSLILGTNAAERARIDASGNFMVGTSSNVTGYKVSVNGAFYQYQTSNGTNASPVLSGGYVCGPADSTIYAGIRFLNSYLSSNASQLAFYVTNTTGSAYEAGRFDVSGNLLVGTTSSASKLTVKASANSYAQGISTVNPASNYWTFLSNSQDHLYLGYNNGDKGYFSNSTGAYTAVSDQRLKKNIADIQYGLNEILALRPVAYNMNEQEDVDAKALGFIAQEAMQVIPESVSEMMGGMYGMDKVAVVPVLVKAIQEQQALIQQLQADVAILKGSQQ